MPIILPPRYAHLAETGLPWIGAALQELGQKEIAGPKSNARILGYRQEAGLAMGGDDGAVPWCAIFVNAMLMRAGLAGSGSAMARSFLASKNFVRLAKPAIGAIAVKASPSRGASAGHVGFYVGEAFGAITLLGGNQGDAVGFASFRQSEFLGFLWPRGAAPPAAGPHRLKGSGAGASTGATKDF